MASISASCSLSKIFKILLISFCVLFFFQYLLDGRRSDTIYTTTTIKGPSALQWPKRTQSRHCFDGAVDASKNGTINATSLNLTNGGASTTKEATNLKISTSETRDTPVNIHSVIQRAKFVNAESNVTGVDNSKDFKTFASDGGDINIRNSNTTVSSQISNVSHPIYDSLSDSVREMTVIPEIGCDIPCSAIPPGLVGPIDVNTTELTLKEVESGQLDLAPGGHYAPRHCKPNDKVAIVIPYRDREAHLAIFLNNMHPFLMKQQIEYQIYIVEQKGHGKFNRASLMNIGFIEANRQHDWNCFIFHDVDLLPLDDRNLYTCPGQPRHLSAAIDKFQFKLPYPTIFGGVSALTTEQFQRVNGFSNSFWGWGGEDDDMANRINYHNYHISRYPMSIARYTMLSHDKENPNPKRYDILMKGKKVFNTDGLNNLQYTLVETQTHKLYTLFLVELHPPS